MRATTVHPTDASPGVDVGALLAGAGRERRRRRERRGDPAPRVGRVDHVVDLEVPGRVASLAVPGHAVDHPVERAVALGRALTGLYLLSGSEEHLDFDDHPTHPAVGTAHPDPRRLQPAAGPGRGP